MDAPADPDRYTSLKLALALDCPNCQSRGLIPWQHLDRLLYCRGCLAMFRVLPGGLEQLDEPQRESYQCQVRSNSSEWHEEKVVLPKRPTLKQRLREAAIQVAGTRAFLRVCILASVLTAVTAIAMMVRHDPRTPARELPVELEDRAVLLAEALVRRDVNLLLRMTDPAQHRAMRIWLAHAKDLPRRISDDQGSVRSELVTKAANTPSGDSVEARVRLRIPPDGDEVFVNQSWVYRGESWYFRPVRLRAALPRRNARPAGKR